MRMNKFYEESLYRARERYNKPKSEINLDSETDCICIFCLQDIASRQFRQKFIKDIYENSVVKYLGACWSCPLLNLDDGCELIFHNCVALGMHELKEWEEFFDGEDSSW